MKMETHSTTHPHIAAASTPEAAPPPAPEPTKAEKDMILREAVSYYLRQDFRDATIRKVCEEFIAGVDDAARGGAVKPKPTTK
jgi:hypothetical protein